MATPISTRPAPAQPVEYVASESIPGAFYKTTPSECSCPAFRFGVARDASYHCKHQIGTFRWLVSFCRICGTETVRVAGDTCTGCAHVYGTQALAAVAPSTDAEIAASDAIKAEIRAELVTAPADTFLARLRATPSPAERNQAALQRHGMSASQGTRLPDRGNDPLSL